FVMKGKLLDRFKPVFFRLADTAQDFKEVELKAGLNRFDSTFQNDFNKIPGSPIAYWVSKQIIKSFSNNESLVSFCPVKEGTTTGDTNRFLKLWQEISADNIGFGCESTLKSIQSTKKWFPYIKGGEFRKWYGNHEYGVNWYNDGEEIKGYSGSTPRGSKFYFKENLNWSKVSSSTFSCRYSPKGFCFDTGGLALFPQADLIKPLIGLMNSKVVNIVLGALSPTLNYTVGNISSLPIPKNLDTYQSDISDSCIQIAQNDWDSYETSWDFTQNPIIRTGQTNLEQAFHTWQQQNADAVAEMKRLEEENNKLFIDAYGLQDE